MFFEPIPSEEPHTHMGHPSFCLNLTVTIIYHRAVLCGGHKKLVVWIHLVSVVPHADLKLNQVLKFGHHGTGKKDNAQPVLLAILLHLKQ